MTSASLYSRDYSPAHHLNNLFQSPQSLSEISSLLNHIHQYKSQLDEDIREDIEQYNTNVDPSSPVGLKTDISQLFEAIRETQQKAIKTEDAITAMSTNIQKLDKTKKNLVLLMTILKRLQMLISANDTLTQSINSKDYKEILQLFSVVKELSSHFKPYKSIDEIATLNGIVNRTQLKLVDDIFSDYEDSINNQLESGSNLQYAGEVLELINPDHKQKLIDWFCKRQLHEIQGIFKSSDEAGLLENVNRRYIFFKKLLTSIQENYQDIFPRSWSIDLEITRKFCDITRDDLKHVLNVYRNMKSGNPDTLLNALTSTLEFEKYLNTTLETEEFEQCILRSFEPYLSVWISLQDSNLELKFMDYLSANKLPEEFQTSDSNGIEEFYNILLTNNVPNIATSSAELFRTYRTILSQTTKLLSGPILLDLTKLFSKFLRKYANLVLSPCLPISESDVVNGGVESLKYLTMVLNTADYCSNTATQLEERIQSTIDEDLKDSVSFDNARESFIQLITQSITLLLAKISNELDFCWRQFSNINWKGMESVGDTSRYIIDCERILVENNLKLILPLIIREGYIRNFCNKVVELIINSFMNQWKNIPIISTINAEQLLLDLEAIKQVLLRLPTYAEVVPNTSESSTVPATYIKFVNQQTHKAETFLKLLLCATKPIDDYVLNYLNLIRDKDRRNFGRVLEMKGVTPNSAEYLQFLDNFQLQVNSGDWEGRELVESSSILAHLFDEPQEAVTSNSQNNSIRRPVPINSTKMPIVKSPILGGAFSPTVPFQANLKNINIEKSFRELTLNGENKVNKINENFKNFGKLFRKNDD